MNKNTPSVAEAIYQCRQCNTIELIDSDGLTESKYNITDALKKQGSKPSPLQVLKSNTQTVHCEKIFILQHSIYRLAKLLPIGQVVMPDDLSPAHPPLKYQLSSSSSQVALLFPSPKHKLSLNFHHCPTAVKQGLTKQRTFLCCPKICDSFHLHKQHDPIFAIEETNTQKRASDHSTVHKNL